jgi:cellulose synthase/poly-beta-1,6-N-acetylglucosamine synthase-like glycosyltransferase
MFKDLNFFNIIILVFQGALLAIFLYYLIISSFAWVKRKEKSANNFAPVNRFAIFVAAHNEQNVISSIVKNLNSLNYPKELYEIFVIADNCTDNTAEIVRRLGVKVYERFNSNKRGKGYALEWAFKRLFDTEKEFDAICVLDADNLVSPNFLMEMNKHLCMGHKVVQGYLDSKNPNDSWISGNNSIAFWISNRLIQLPRYYLGLSCILGGTGFIISTSVVKEFGWGATCLAEDLEFSLKLIKRGMKVYWAHDAVIYDEKPLKLVQSWKQRKRWMQGHFDCAKRFLVPLITKAVREKNVVAMDSALYLLQPIIVVINGLVMISSFMYVLYKLVSKLMNLGVVEVLVKTVASLEKSDNLITIFVMFASMYLCIVFVLLEGKLKSARIFRYLLTVPIYNLTWVPIIVQGFLDRNKKEWSHTLHIRAIEISEVEGMQKAG